MRPPPSAVFPGTGEWDAPSWQRATDVIGELLVGDFVIGDDTSACHRSCEGTPIYEAIRQRKGIDPAVIGARAYWSFPEACLRLFGERHDPFLTDEETADGPLK